MLKPEIHKTDKEILDSIQDGDLDGCPVFEEIAPKNLPSVSLESLNWKETFLLDVRSPAEYEETHIPGAMNFPILDNLQRHEVGLLYKKKGKQFAVKRALEFANPKLESLFQLCKEKQNILVYCWRGGGRSSFTVNSLIGQGIFARKLQGGHKAWRNLVYQTLYEKTQPKFIVLKGLTGVGKTDLIQKLKSKIRILDLEGCAKNSASSFGRIPWILQNNWMEISQKHFEDNIYKEMFLDEKPIAKRGIPIESESRRIGNVHLPGKVFEAMLQSDSIELICSTESRVERIYKDYIGENQKGLPLLANCIKSLQKYTSKEQMEIWMELLQTNQIHELLKSLLIDYYDKKYSGIFSDPLIQIRTDNMEQALEQTLDFLGVTL